MFSCRQKRMVHELCFSTLSLQKCFCDCDNRQSDYCRIYQSFLHACYTSINLIKPTDNKGLLQARLKDKIRMVKIKQIIQKAPNSLPYFQTFFNHSQK